jgi:hypothetical protein
VFANEATERSLAAEISSQPEGVANLAEYSNTDWQQSSRFERLFQNPKR